MSYKGIILAGGNGTRLSPVTKIVNKHLLPIHDKPLIYYSLSILLLCKIRQILIICKKNDLESYKTLLGDGKRFGVNLSYEIQEKPSGIPDAFIIGKNFIKNSKVALILGDNFFYGHRITEKLLKAKSLNKNCTIFVYPVKNPSSFGVIELDKNKKIKSIKEKPKKSISNLAITGFYLFDNDVINFAKKLKPSLRNETEIISILKKYKNKKRLSVQYLGRGSAWLDTGTLENINDASMFVKNIEQRQGFKIACLEEIALLNNWIKKSNLKEAINFYGNCEYSKYLKSL